VDKIVIEHKLYIEGTKTRLDKIEEEIKKLYAVTEQQIRMEQRINAIDTRISDLINRVEAVKTRRSKRARPAYTSVV